MPRIRANYLTHDEDWRMMVDGWKIARQIRDTDPFKSLITAHHLPGPDVQSDDDFVWGVGAGVNNR